MGLMHGEAPILQNSEIRPYPSTMGMDFRMEGQGVLFVSFCGIPSEGSVFGLDSRELGT